MYEGTTKDESPSFWFTLRAISANLAFRYGPGHPVAENQQCIVRLPEVSPV